MAKFVIFEQKCEFCNFINILSDTEKWVMYCYLMHKAQLSMHEKKRSKWWKILFSWWLWILVPTNQPLGQVLSPPFIPIIHININIKWNTLIQFWDVNLYPLINITKSFRLRKWLSRDIGSHLIMMDQFMLYIILSCWDDCKQKQIKLYWKFNKTYIIKGTKHE